MAPGRDITFSDGRVGIGTRSVAAGWETPATLYAGSLQGLHRSRDCGMTWELLADPPYTASAPGVEQVAAGPDHRLYISRQYLPTRVSADAGRTWQPDGIITNRENLRAFGLLVAPSPTVPGLAYGFFEHPVSVRGAIGLARTTDGGLTWEFRSYERGRMVVDPADPDTVYSLSITCVEGGRAISCVEPLRRSTDGGLTFQSFGKAVDGAFGLALSVDGSRFWTSASDGTLRWSLDQGQTWTIAPDKPFTETVGGLSPSPFDPRAVFMLNDSGEVWAYRAPDAAADPAYPEDESREPEPGGP